MDADKEAAQAAVKALREPRTMYPCPNPACQCEYATPDDAARCHRAPAAGRS